jgi:hypothetical protein
MTHEAGEKDKTVQVQISLPFCFLIVYVHNMLLGSELDFDPGSINFNCGSISGKMMRTRIRNTGIFAHSKSGYFLNF